MCGELQLPCVGSYNSHVKGCNYPIALSLITNFPFIILPSPRDSPEGADSRNS
jgi:hypothetical protein